MPFFKLAASSQGAKHTHIIYQNDDGTGRTTVNKGHFHEVGFETITTDEMNPQNGMLETRVLSQNIVVMEANGHTHDIKDLTFKREAPSSDDKEVVEDIQKLFKRAEAYAEDNRKRGHINEEYYCNYQWDRNDKNNLESSARPCLTINLSQAAIKSLGGYQRNNRTDLKFFPVEEGDAKVADILTEVSKIILEGSNFPLEETEAFFQTLIAGQGFLNIYIDYSKNINGEIVVEQFDWRDVYPGQHNKKDFSDLEYLIKVKWYSKEQLKRLYPKKAKDIDAMWDRNAATEDDSKSLFASKHTDQGQEQPDGYMVQPNAVAEDIDANNKNVRVKECWRKEYVRRYIFADPANEYVLALDDWPEADAESLKSIPGINLIDRTIFRMRVTKIAGECILEDEYPDLAAQDFHIIPIYAEKIRDRVLSKMDFVRDLQDETNKRISTLADILNKCNGYGTYYDEEMFETRDDMEEFENKASGAGFMQKLRDVNRRPVREEGVKFPVELERMTMMMVQMFDRLMNVNPELLGQRGNSESGVAQIQKIKQALMGNEYLFDNLSLAKKKLGRMLVAMVQKIYDAKRIYRILNNQNIKKQGQVQIGGQPMERYTEQDIVDLLDNADLTKYDVAVEESSSSPTVRYANFLLLADLAGKGLPIPMPLLIEIAPIPENEKQKAMQMVQQQMQAEQAAEERKYNTEIQKTIIAKGAPPAPGAPNGSSPLPQGVEAI